MSDAATTFDPAALVREKAAAGTWPLDPAASRVEFVAKSIWGLVTVRGYFANVSGRAQVSDDGMVTAELQIDAGSVDTKQKKRDTHLRSADFFHAAVHPNMDVRADRAVITSPTTARIEGLLTAAGQSQPLLSEATIELQPDGHQATVDTTIDIDRSRFGMTWNPMGMAKPNVTVHAHLVFRR